MMKWASAVSGTPEAEQAAREVCEQVTSRLDGSSVDLAVLFVSGEHGEQEMAVTHQVLGAISPGVLVGCSAGGVIGDGREVEERPGISLTVASLPDVELTPFHLERDDAPTHRSTESRVRSAVGLRARQRPAAFILLADAVTFPPEPLLDILDRNFPFARKLGGLASGRQGGPGNTLFLDGERYHSGMVGVALCGAVEVDTIVAQGCRPIGTPMVVTRARGSLLLEADGRPVVQILRELFEGMNGNDQRLFRHSLFLGLGMREGLAEYGPGDFLVRHVAGIDPQSEGLVVAATLHEDQTVQFHLRDAAAAEQDLEQCLARAVELSRPAPRPAGALLFSCLGRGMHMFGYPDHDTDSFRKHFGALPLGGFFCNGEIGPVLGRTFLHGYTSSFGLFRPPARVESEPL